MCRFDTVWTVILRMKSRPRLRPIRVAREPRELRADVVERPPSRARFAGALSQPLAPDGWGSGIAIAPSSLKRLPTTSVSERSGRAAGGPRGRRPGRSAPGEAAAAPSRARRRRAPARAVSACGRRVRTAAAPGSSASPTRSRRSRRTRPRRARASGGASARRGRATAGARRPRRRPGAWPKRYARWPGRPSSTGSDSSG